jgi:hypothetical protein
VCGGGGGCGKGCEWPKVVCPRCHFLLSPHPTRVMLPYTGEVAKFPAGNPHRDAMLDTLASTQALLDPVAQQSLYGNVTTLLAGSGRA